MILWKLISKNSMNKIIEYMYRSLTEQTIQTIEMKPEFNRSVKLVFNSVLIIWILSATILTKCFTSLLLGIYSTQKSVPLVDSIDDIIANKELQIIDSRNQLAS